MRRRVVLSLLGLLAPWRLAVSQCPDGTPPPCAGRVGARAPSANSVAVLLFDNLTRDSSVAYLSDGLASEISTSLARVPRLEVTSPGAVRAAPRSGGDDPQTIGHRLNVRYVVEGDLQRGGDRIRVAVRLVTVQNGVQRWTDSYTRPMADLLAVQEEIASAVATAIAGELLPQERTALAAHPTRNPEAYDHLLRGNFYLAQRTPAGVRRAIDEYTAAVRLDSTLAQAQARIALGYILYLDWGWRSLEMPPETLLVRALAAVDVALRLDSTSGDAWMARGYALSFRHPRTFEGALPSLERAVALDPRNAEAWHQYSGVLLCLGRFEDAAVAEERALALEPQRPISLWQMGVLMEILHRDTEVGPWYDSALAVDRGFYLAFDTRSWLRMRHGDLAGARADAEAALRASPLGEEHWGLGVLAAVTAREGDSAAARALVERALTPFAGRGALPFQVTVNIGSALMAVGEPARAVELLRRGEPQGYTLYSWLVLRMFDPLRADPGFQRLFAEIQPPGAH